ncbi:MAG: alanine racemase [Chlamydiae bacterium]|nr:alanine racemase [Chlamydiota bacterium]
MPLLLHVDGQKWRSHLSAMVNAKPGLIPVIKGNGYGFGLEFLAAESTRLGVSTVAVGLASEVEKVRSAFAGEIIVLSPDHNNYAFSDSKVLQTISSLELLHTIDVKSNVIIEILTPLNRHGINTSDIANALTIIGNRGLNLRGFALHLPIARIENSWISSTLAKLPEGSTVYISHLVDGDKVGKEFPQLTFRERIGTSLWLGADSAMEVTATVLEDRKIQGPAGYRQRRVRTNIIVASGGTAHGVGLSAPQGDRSLIGRIKIITSAVKLSFGKMRSPYLFEGKVLNFLEAPHMQCSQLILKGSAQPKVGDELKVHVRYTTTTFDQIILR